MQAACARLLLVDTQSQPSVQDLGLDLVAVDRAVQERGPFDAANPWGSLAPAHSNVEELRREADNVLLYMHTSGSTGHPKLVPWTHKFAILTSTSAARIRPNSIGSTLYTMLPLSHGSGTLFAFITMFGLRGLFTFVDSRKPPSADTVISHLTLMDTPAVEIVLPPSILEDIVDGMSRDAHLEVLKLTRVVMFSGAPMRPDVGDILSRRGVPIVSCIGASETGPLSTFVFNPSRAVEDWPYFELVDTFKFLLKPTKEDQSTKELVVLPGEIQPLLLNHADPIGYATHDHIVRHPDPQKAHLWKHMGRLNDVMVLSNGEKTNAAQLVNLLCASPLVQHAVIFGEGRFMSGAIVSPPAGVAPGTHSHPTVSQYLDTVWDHVARNVNGVVPSHSRLPRALLLVALLEKPFLLTDKLSVKVPQTLALYRDDIDSAYTELERDGYNEVPLPAGGTAASYDSIESHLKRVVEVVLQREVGVTDDLFDAGMDSLLVLRLHYSLVALIRRFRPHVEVARNVVYTCPTIAGLVEYVWSVLSSGNDASSYAGLKAPARSVEDTIQRHLSALLPSPNPSSGFDVGSVGSARGDGRTYAVTGTTGSLGSFFVSLLLQKATVHRIYLLNRGNNVRSMEYRHRNSFAAKGLDFEPFASALKTGRAVFVEIDLSQKNLGISSSAIPSFLAEVTHFVHAAWTLNFNLVLASFDTHIAAVRHIIEMIVSSARPILPTVVFLSSIGVLARWRGGARAPEARAPTADTAAAIGYAQAKYVAEQLIEGAAARYPGLRAVIVRCGQLSAAAATGIGWAEDEHIPVLVRSCRSVGLVPNDLPDVHWLPLDIAAQALYALMGAADADAVAYFHLEATATLPWATVARAIARYDSERGALRLVPAAVWLGALRESADARATALLPFFAGLAAGDGPCSLDTRRAGRLAGALLDYRVSEELLFKYVEGMCRA
ncbi:acetyl-CoA synthetase-like protein [Auriscalpium vulgare]|uniref:Acetyl-CoA synthetase-like protein n=1 Tax=Auriscalpium vulgare TaxID=40419 RepID=A0ACB8R811_9AGAM|nr:acetyl-CoA synthetase-like protein [Auriscalpium vulgare]